MNRKIWCFLALLLIISLHPAQVRAEVPESGLRAEMAGEWEEALSIYRGILSQDPGRIELRVRSADILSRLGRAQEAAQSLEEVAIITPGDADIHFRLSRAHAAAGNPRKALQSCLRASELAPENPEYVRTCAVQASWAGETDLARTLYERLLSLAPEDADALLGRARTRAWTGEVDLSVRDYRAYLEKKPEDREARIEYARVQGWRGDSAEGLEILEDYRKRFGADPQEEALRVRLLAAGGRPRQALSDLNPLLEADPGNFDLRYTRVLALHRDNSPADALEGMAYLEKVRPDAPEVRDLGLVVRTPLRSRIELTGNYYNDSDDISSYRGTLEGTLFLSPETAVEIGGFREELSADHGSGLERSDGGEDIGHGGYWLGASRRFSPVLALGGRLGRGVVEDGDDYWIYRVRADLRPADYVDLILERERELYALSPRAVSEEVRRTANRARILWRPGLRYTVDLTAGYDTFSDGNRRWEAILAPRRQVLRTGSFNLDLGVATWWFGFDEDLDHGYYDPGTYQRHALTAFGYWKIGDDHGLGLTAGLGVQKDEEMSGYRFGEDVALEGIFGIFSDWMLRTSLSYADRDQESGSFDGFSAQVKLTRRF
ncbi:tetratricopeptide repeat protein [Desulfuromonas sp. TF]|uniref:tetratricopeptide repeat protein n=1 Tax=Desulfuromonas sp. TF TaxID=1232410 RepID=UPI000410EA5A|nr:tetratricopeptide repeat protein [Desulfuromonas sp. TF]